MVRRLGRFFPLHKDLTLVGVGKRGAVWVAGNGIDLAELGPDTCQSCSARRGTRGGLLHDAEPPQSSEGMEW